MREIAWKPDEGENDFVGYDGNKYIGRTYLTGTIHTGQQWKWFLPNGGSPPSGTAESRLAAMMILEEKWAEWLAIKASREAQKA